MKHLVLILLSLLIAGTPAASAHPRREAEIDISFNPNSGLTEIVHRYRILDSEAVVQSLFDPSLGIKEDPEAQALFGEYIENRFSLRHDGKRVPLELVGGEINDGYIWIYQTAAELPKDGIYVLRASELMDVHTDQVNIVNVRLHDQVQSFVFSRSAPFVTFRLDGASVY